MSPNSFKWISEAAYYLAEVRHFSPGMALNDWLTAESKFFDMQILRFRTISDEDGGMSIIGLQRLANSLCVKNAAQLTVIEDLIHAIQQATDNEHCFNVEPGIHCNETKPCAWKADCKKMIAIWHPLKQK